VALPDHDEVAVRLSADCRSLLEVQRVRIDLEVDPEAASRADDELPEHGRLAPVVSGVSPGDGEAVVRKGEDLRVAFRALRRCVDLELGADARPRAREALHEDAVGRTVESIPAHHECAGRFDCDGKPRRGATKGPALNSHGEGAHLELGAELASAAGE